ncbi:hypothetical protein RCH06_001620 [Polaromonas sp. CG_9.5]|nr:hypothetical protein [Polaromonas sp. CG_9.5]
MNMMNRRFLLRTLASLTAAAALTPSLMAQTRPKVEVWKDPDCGCCKDWVSHLEANGFQVSVHDSGNAEARTRLGVPDKLGSCHTAQVGGYALEGHVPARDIKRLLKERPKAVGLAVPGMPVGSPGMDGPEYKGRKDPYDVLLIQANGSSKVYQSYRTS